MATKIQTLLIDDLDGGPAERTVRFALDGQDYETELSVPHLLELTQSLSPYIGAARTVPNGNGRGKGKRGRKTPGRAAPPHRPAGPLRPCSPPPTCTSTATRSAHGRRPSGPTSR